MASDADASPPELEPELELEPPELELLELELPELELLVEVPELEVLAAESGCEESLAEASLLLWFDVEPPHAAATKAVMVATIARR
jgi:hypothetical protein